MGEKKEKKDKEKKKEEKATVRSAPDGSDNNHYISLYIIIIDEASVMAKKGNISHFLHFFFCVAKYWSNEAVLPLKILWRFPYIKSFCCSAVKMVGPSTMPAMNWGKEAVGSPLFVWKY